MEINILIDRCVHSLSNINFKWEIKRNQELVHERKLFYEILTVY